MAASYCEMTMTLQRRNIQRRSIGIVAHVDAGTAAFAAGQQLLEPVMRVLVRVWLS
jgi:hypothetical protein